MKPLMLTNHAITQYEARTGRHGTSSLTELFNAVHNGKILTRRDLAYQGFTISHAAKGDWYVLWYDTLINDMLLAIIASDGAIKTVLRQDMYSCTGASNTKTINCRKYNRRSHNDRSRRR